MILRADMTALALGPVFSAALLAAPAAAAGLPAGPGQDIVSTACTQCHGIDVIQAQHKTAGDWADTVRQMVANGAHVSDADFDKVVKYLTQNYGAMRVPEGAPQHDQGFASYQAIPGKPFQVHPPEKAVEVPAFPQQTRAPYQASAPYRVTTLTDKLHYPWSLAFLPDGDLLITEKTPAAMRILHKDGTLSAPLAGLSAVSRVPDFGLLDVALDPRFAQNRQIFFTFFEVVTPQPGGKPTNSNTYVARARLDQAGLTDVKVIFRTTPAIPSPRLGLKTGGRIAIDRDGNLFVTIGDRSDVTPWDVAQKLDTDLGKIIHITPDGAPVPGNPFIGTPGALPEIWTYGNRSEEGLAFDPATGKLWEDEHGPRGGDEVNVIEKGRNYGWPVIAYGIDYDGKPITGGLTQKPGMEQPVYFWDPVIAPSGLAFYQGDLFPQWKGSLFVGGLRGKLLTRLVLADGKIVAEEPMLTDLDTPIRDVRVGPDGAVYVLTLRDRLLKLTPK